ncbi:MAG: IS200/IS605 family accessory protein TnpB-related protein [Coleofasciculus sp. C1-SOL-03]|uniref:IS200/IS605 family accessory protein TnpB-related protein n=1 Tax=Coleofasciculus sp. C1-SOL-03 TaxID=3069522 RepID=UPI0033013B19
MPSSESRTYVTTTTVPWAVAYLNDAATIGYDAKIESLKWLLEKKPASKSRLNQQLQQNHSLNKRQANSIIAYVEGQVKSSKESRGNHLKQLIGQLKHTTEVIEKLEKKIKAHRKYLQAFEQVNRGKRKKVPQSLKPKYPEACPMRCADHLTLYQFAQVKLHQKKRYAHKLRQKIAHLKASDEHVNLGNKYTVEMIGSKDESYGNQICQLDLIGKELHIRVPYALEHRYGSCIQFPIRLPQHGTDLLATAWYNRQALTYRFIQKSLTEWEIHITFDVEPAPRITAPVSWGAIGVDLNPNCIGWAMTDKDGNLDGFGQVKVNIQSQPKGRTEAIVVDVVTDLTTIALEYKRPIVVEKLDFTEKKKRLRELNAKARRMLSNFAYSKFLQLLKARCFKLGIQVIEVNPAYSSWIALIKFMSMYGMNSATAAAFVLARRGMFLSERLPANTAYQGTEPRKHVWSDWRSVAKRTKGSSRHSFFQPRLTVYSRLRSVRGFHSPLWDEAISAVDNPNGELGEVGENPTGSRYTA